MAQTTAAANAGGKTPVTTRWKVRAEARKKRKLKIRDNKEFAKAYFEARSKRATDKKAAFRKKKKQK